jgi:pre-rRNA-processing protein TSR1
LSTSLCQGEPISLQISEKLFSAKVSSAFGLSSTLASSVPFRFKAGEAAAAAHHHRSATKSTQKPFKSRHATKSAIKDSLKGRLLTRTVELDTQWLTRAGKIPSLAPRARPQTPHQAVLGKIARRNQARQQRLRAAAARREERSVFAPPGAGVAPAPRIVAVVALATGADARQAAARLLRAAGGGEADADGAEGGGGAAAAGDGVAYVERWRQSVAWMPVRAGALCEALDACRVADFVVFVLDAREEEVDPAAVELLRAVEGQGISNVLACAVVSLGLQARRGGPDGIRMLARFRILRKLQRGFRHWRRL